MACSKRDMVFSVLFVGDERLIRHFVTDSSKRLGADDWMAGIQAASLVRLRVMFFLLLDRDSRWQRAWPLAGLGLPPPGAESLACKPPG